ncbi:trypsin-like peptidase domain-containing protein [Undibacterium sp. JH2W]|uniref:trypsin-like peptidase domain-containing protein n=1 Tax=Undibacterium sp. JH2W TaxID=3413037 RepID=UPI003BF209DB
MKQTLYDILTVRADATTEQIRVAYQDAMAGLESVEQHDPNKKVLVREAYELLSHPQKRASYDAHLARRETVQAQATSDQTRRPAAPAKPRNLFVPLVLLALLLAAAGLWWSMKQKMERNKQAEIPVYSEVTPAGPAKLPPAPLANTPAPVTAPVAAAPTPEPTTSNVDAGKSAEEIYALRSPSIALISVYGPTGAQVALGSGVVIAPEVVITNCHVTRAGVQYKAKIGKDVLAATVTMADEEFDLCRLSVPGSTAPAVALGSTDSLRIGQKVFAIGAPLGLDLTISDGIVSALRPLPAGKVIQTTAPISHGSSGGGLFDAAGKLVGINTFNVQDGQAQNLNFAVPVDWISTMSSRRGSNQSVGAMTINSIVRNRDGNKDSNRDSNAQASTAQQAATKILGLWNCYGVLTGYSMEVLFDKDSKMSGTINGKKFTGNYLFDGKSLSLSMGNSVSGVVEEFTGNKLVVNGGKADRLVCNRR